MLLERRGTPCESRSGIAGPLTHSSCLGAVLAIPRSGRNEDTPGSLSLYLIVEEGEGGREGGREEAGATRRPGPNRCLRRLAGSKAESRDGDRWVCAPEPSSQFSKKPLDLQFCP
jgi:hypothetical protein